MALDENKLSFILYCDLIKTVEKLPDDIAGRLFKTILQYVNDFNPEPTELILQIAFEPIKQQLKRDLKSWISGKQAKSEAGKKGMESRWKNHNKVITKITKDNSVISEITEITVNDIVNVNETVKVNEKKINIDFPIFWNLYDLKKGDKEKIEKKWNALTDEIREKIMIHIPKYKIEQPEKKYRKHPETYLNNKSWNDEIILIENNHPKTNIDDNIKKLRDKGLM